AKHQHHIFSWFSKGRDSGPMSSGIGLALAKKIVHLHHGEISVQSAEGQGAAFTIILPLGKNHFKPENFSAVTSPSGILPVYRNVPRYLPEVAELQPGDDGARKGLQSL